MRLSKKRIYLRKFSRKLTPQLKTMDRSSHYVIILFSAGLARSGLRPGVFADMQGLTGIYFADCVKRDRIPNRPSARLRV
jgi:hypothetical protein